MSTYVVDASVVAKWFFPEIHSDDANRLRNPSYHLHAPEFLRVEFGNIVWRKTREGDITKEDGDLCLQTVRMANVQYHSVQTYYDQAFEFACSYGRSFYDSLYISLAENLEGRLVTADKKLFNAVNNTAIEQRILWVEHLPE